MINITIDKEINILISDFSYHNQKVPRPGGHKYSICIDKTEPVFAYFQRLYKYDLGEEFFVDKMLKSQKNYFNPIIQLQGFLDPKSISFFNSPWVFNNIEEVKITEETLEISGIASKFIEDFRGSGYNDK